MTWTADANCRGLTSLFFPESRAVPEAARALCATCTVRNPCRTYALVADEQHGIWAGMSAEELRGSRIPYAVKEQAG